jgi:hypothetical protein
MFKTLFWSGLALGFLVGAAAQGWLALAIVAEVTR